MRDLKRCDDNKLFIKDAVSDTQIELSYRMPTTQEMVQYQARQVHRVNGKVVLKPFETRLEFGLKILTSIREGDFGYDGKPISCDLNSEHYREDWKALLKESAADIITTLALTVFEGARLDTGDVVFEGEDAGAGVEAGEATLPLAQS